MSISRQTFYAQHLSAMLSYVCHMSLSSYHHRHHSNLSPDASMVNNKQEDLGDERTSGGKKLKIITSKTCINVIQVYESVSGVIENAPLPPTNSS